MGLAQTDVSSVDSDFLTEVKANVSIHSTNTDHDTELTDIALAAITILERACRRQFTTRAVVWWLDAFPDVDCLEVPLPPMTILTSIEYYDVNDSLQTWSSANYLSDLVSQPGRIAPISSQSWPSTYDRENAVKITYSAGYGSEPNDYPAPIKQAIKLTVRAWFEETTPQGDIPSGALALIDGYKSGRFSQFLHV